MALLGGDAQANSTANNSINFNPSIILGDDNDTRSSSEQTQRAEARSTNSNDTAASLGLGIGGGNGSGGPASLAKPGGVQSSTETKGVSSGFAGMSSNVVMIVVAGVIGLGGLMWAVMSGKKKAK